MGGSAFLFHPENQPDFSQLRPLAGLRQSERKAYECILEFLEEEQVVRQFPGAF